MRKILILFCIFICGFSSSLNAKGHTCKGLSYAQAVNNTQDDARKNALASIDYALSYIKKALESKEMSDLETYARRAQSAADDAESFSDDLNNEEAEWYCDSAARDLRRARNESSRKAAEEYLLKARKALNTARSNL